MRFAVSCVLGVILLVQHGTAVLARQSALEYEVKAAFLLNFVRYVAWPPAQRQAPFNMCVLSTNPFGERLNEALAGETWEGEAMSLRRISETREARSCHMLYVPASATGRFVSNHSQLLQRPVLTVGETRAFLTSGGMIQLFVEDSKVRFSVNQAAAEAAGLQISSRLLRLAREVVTRREPGL